MSYVAGMDIGGTKCATLIARIGEEATFLSRVEFATAGTAEAIIDRCLDNLEKQLAELQLTASDLTGVGISCGGPLDAEKGLILSPPNLPGWDHVPIVALTEKRLGRPAQLKNDADACALAEWKFGAGRGKQHLIFLTFGTGLGAGLILNGALYVGSTSLAGELGHWRMTAGGVVGHNKAGALEGYCSGGGLARLAILHQEEFRDSSLYAACRDATVTAKAIIAAARASDHYAQWLVERSGQVFGMALSYMIDLLNPELVIVGGIFVRAQDLLLPHIRKVIDRETLPANRGCAVVPAALGERIGDYGALCAFSG